MVASIIRGMSGDGAPEKAPAVVRALEEYADLVKPWAEAVSEFMLRDVALRDEAMWRANSKALGLGLGRELATMPTGQIMWQLQEEQVSLITSLPREAAERVNLLASQAVITGDRSKVIAADIMKTGQVTAARARMIARTEVSRASQNLVQARSQFAGSDGYIWRTSGDRDVRDSHAAMEGKYVRWSSPPTLDGLKGHAGTLPNCRCFAEPVFPDFD